MDTWEIMFRQVQSMVPHTQPLEQNVAQIVAFALSHPDVFDAPAFWDQVQHHDFQPAFMTVTDWAKQGLEALDAQSGWQFLVLDLGDCPESFRLYSPGGQSRMSEETLQKQMKEEIFADFQACFDPASSRAFGLLYGNELVELTDHHVSELSDTILDWTSDEARDDHGSSGCLLWLLLGSLALIEPLRDPAYCRSILKGRDKLYLFSGFEEIFFPVATVTPDGIVPSAVRAD